MAYLKGLTSNSLEGRESIIQISIISIPWKTRTIQMRPCGRNGSRGSFLLCRFWVHKLPHARKISRPGAVHATRGAPVFMHVGVDSRVDLAFLGPSWLLSRVGRACTAAGTVRRHCA